MHILQIGRPRQAVWLCSPHSWTLWCIHQKLANYAPLPVSVNKMSPGRSHLCIYMVSTALFTPQLPNEGAATETIWPWKTEISTLWPFTERKVANLQYQLSTSLQDWGLEGEEITPYNNNNALCLFFTMSFYILVSFILITTLWCKSSFYFHFGSEETGVPRS